MTGPGRAGDQGGMNTSMRWLASVILFTTACDSKSNEIGSTVGEEGSTGGMPIDPSGTGGSSGTDPGVSSSGETTSPLGACGEALSADACAAVDLGDESQDECVWVAEINTSDEVCSIDAEPTARCIMTQYVGDGCAPSPCVDDENVYRRELGDGTFEWLAMTFECGQEPVGFTQCSYDGFGENPPGCDCVCEGLGGTAPGAQCDPLGDACPDTPETSQECEPDGTGTSWSCFPQNAGTSPAYGDECWPEDSPTVACTGQTICLDAEGLGVEGCDGGEGGGCCTMLCDLFDDFDPCPDEGQVCAPFYADDVPEGYEHVGVCRLP